MFDSENKEFSEHLVTINRVAKVVKGGRRFGFAAIMIVADNKGKVSLRIRPLDKAIVNCFTILKR